MALLPPLVLPPRPPELPVAVPPPELGQTVPAKGPYVRNDAFLAQWVDDFERVVKDNWIKLNALLQVFNDRIVALEKRIADTYTFGQKGPLTASTEPGPGVPGAAAFLALPLRVVRDEELVEVVAACETMAVAGPTSLMLQRNGNNVHQLTLDVGVPLAEFIFTTPLKMKRNDKLRVRIQASADAEDVVFQARCR